LLCVYLKIYFTGLTFDYGFQLFRLFQTLFECIYCIGLFLDCADQVWYHVRRIHAFVIWPRGMVDRMHQFGHDLFYLLGDETDMCFCVCVCVCVCTITSSFNLGFPLVSARIQCHDLGGCRVGIEWHDVGLEARIGGARERRAARREIDARTGLIDNVEDARSALADVVVGGGVLVGEGEIGTVYSAIGTVHDGDIGRHREVGGRGLG